MSSLSNQQGNSKSLSGLSDDYSSNIVTNTLEVTDVLTVDTGGIINLPANSLQDAYLSSNVALLNRTPQTFTGNNNFLTQPSTDNSTLVSTTAYVKNQGYASLAGTQTFTGINTFNALTVHNATLRNFQSTQAVFPGDFRMLDSTQTYLTQMYQNGTLCVIDASFASSRIGISTRNASASAITNLLMENNNHVIIQGSASAEIDILGTTVSLNGVCSFTNTTTPTITQTIATADNSNKIATTSFVKAQNYALASDLSNYGLLTGANTWTGTTNTFSNASLGNQISIQSTANSGPSTISQVTNSLVISAVTNNTGAFQSTLTLSSRTATNTGCVLFNGNSTTINIGQNSTNTNISSTNLTMSGVCSFTNTTTPVITQSIALSDSSTNIATTAFVKNQGYATLAGTQTFTGVNTFNALTVHNQTLRNFQSTQAVFPGDFRMLDSTQTYLTQMYQNGTLCVIDAPFASSRISIITRDSSASAITNLLIENNNHVVLQGSASAEIDILGTAVSLNGVCSFTNVTTPVITQTIATADNSNKIVTSNWVNLQAFLTSSALTPYALLTPSTNPQVFTGQQKFQSTTTNLPISVASTTGGVTGAGGLFVATVAGQYNPIVKGNDCVLVGTGSGIDNANTKLTLTTYASAPVGIQMDIGNMTFDGGIIRQNSNFNCGYSYLATPGTVKGFYDIGYVWTIPSASFTGTSWATSTVVYNILTLAWDGSGNKRIGVWKVDVVIINTCTTAPSSSLCWNTVSNVSRTINDTCVGASDLFLFGATGCQIMRMSFTINVVNLTTTYYLNSLTGGGAGLASNTASQITFTRLA